MSIRRESRPLVEGYSMKTPALTFIVALLTALLLLLPPLTAQASMIGTQEVIAEQALQADRDKFSEFLNRADVEQRLQAMDVPAALARSRVDALTPAETAVDDQIDLVFEQLAHFVGIAHWQRLARQNQADAHQWLAEFAEQRLGKRG